MTLRYKKEREKNYSFKLGSIRNKTIEECSNFREFIELCAKAETEFGKLVNRNYRCIAPFIKPKPLRNIKSTIKDYDKYIDDKKEWTLKELVKHWYFLGEGYRMFNCYEKSIENCNFGLKAISDLELSIPDYESLLYITRGKSQSNKGDIKEALDSFKSASKSIRKLSRKNEIRIKIEGELNLAYAGCFFVAFNKPDRKILSESEWRSYSEKAEKSFSKLDDEMRMGYAKWEQLRMYRALGEIDKVAQLIDEIKETIIKEKSDNDGTSFDAWKWTTWMKHDESELARLTGDFPLAKKLNMELFKESRMLGNLNRMSNALIGQAEIERQLGHTNKARFYLLLVKMIPSKVGDPVWRDRTLREIKKLIKERSTEYHQINFV